MCRASELIICFNIKSAGCDLVRRYGGKWLGRRERINKSQRSGPYFFASHECVSHRQERRLNVSVDAYMCMWVCAYTCMCAYTCIRRIRTTCVEKGGSRVNESSPMPLQSRSFAAAGGKSCRLAGIGATPIIDGAI